MSRGRGDRTERLWVPVQDQCSCVERGLLSTILKSPAGSMSPPELCGDDDLWLIATFYAQRSKQFQQWWQAQNVPSRQRRLRSMSSGFEDSLVDFLSGDPSLPEGMSRDVYMEAPPHIRRGPDGEDMVIKMLIHSNPVIALFDYFADAALLGKALLRAGGNHVRKLDRVLE